MGVEAQHEEESEVVSVPEDLESLLANFGVGSGVHQDHDEQHKVTSDSTWLFIVDIEGGLLANF